MATSSAGSGFSLPDLSEKRRMHPLLRKLQSLYADLAGNAPLPVTGALQTETLTWLKDKFCTLSVLPHEKDYRFEVCGSRMRLFCGHDIREHHLSEMETHGGIPAIHKDLDLVVLARRPRYSTGSMIWEDGLRLECEWLILPFSGRHGRISTLIIAEMAHPPAGGYAQTPRQHRTHPRLEMHAMIWPAFHRRVPQIPSGPVSHHH